jgi:hypothetical protein
MAYGFPATYQPMYYPSTIQQVPQQVPQQIPQQPTQQTQNNLIWVSGEAGAKAYLLAPNTTMPLWDSESQTIYLKSADASGMPSMRIIDYTIRDNAPKTPNLAANNDFVTKDELQTVINELNALKAKFKPRKDRNESVVSADDRQSK